MEHKMQYPICQNGFQAKTINIRTTAGGLKFNLQQINELGLPHDCTILGLWMRPQVNTITASNGLNLVSNAVFTNSYLSLKDRSSFDGRIDLVFSEFGMVDLQRAKFVQPISSDLIDWNQSFIQLNPRATAVDNAVYEIVVIYSAPDSEPEFPNRLFLRTGEQFAGLRIASFEVPLNTTQTQYPLSNSDNIGIPQNALIMGFSTNPHQNPLFGELEQNTASLDCTYITFKQGTCAFIDQFPASLNNYELLLQQSHYYFPVLPTQVMAIDWQQSKIEITDNTGILDGMVFQFTLYWWSPDC